MKLDGYEKLCAMETTPEALQASCEYIASRLKPFLSTLEPVLICFRDEGPASLGGIFKTAVEMCGATAIVWGPDYRWMELLRIAFDSHANTVIAHPLVALGLLKLANVTSTPLYIYDLVFGGYPYSRWMVDGVKKGLDCRVWGCYAAKCGPVIIGFTCDREAGIHVRNDVFDLQILDEQGNTQSYWQKGKIRFVSRKDPEVVYEPGETAIMHYQPCSCGCDAPRLAELTHYSDEITINQLEERLLSWSSVLDYRVEYTESGINLEVVVFPGEKLPKIPSCAKLIVRNWNPQEDIPFFIQDTYLKIPEKTV